MSGDVIDTMFLAKFAEEDLEKAEILCHSGHDVKKFVRVGIDSVDKTLRVSFADQNL